MRSMTKVVLSLLVLLALAAVGTPTAAIPGGPTSLSSPSPAGLFLPPSMSPTSTSSSSSSSSSSLDTPMYVLKRNNSTEPIAFDKITARLRSLMSGLDSAHVDVSRVAQKVVLGIYPGVRTSELDTLAAETAAYMATSHPDYGRLAARVAVSNLHKETPRTFCEAMDKLARAADSKGKRNLGFLDPGLARFAAKHRHLIDSKIKNERDLDLTYFGFKTLERAYLLKDQASGRPIERPQYLLMRVALGIHCAPDIAALNNSTASTTSSTSSTSSSSSLLSPAEVSKRLQAAFETYDLMSRGFFTHASPTLFHSGTTHPQLSSCFLLDLSEDSIPGIYSTLAKCAVISKGAGGIGLSVHNVRARGSLIAGTGGTSNGLVPMLRVFDATSRYVDQGGGKRPGAFAVYLEPWHADVFEVLELKKNSGKEEQRARDLFYAMWIPDLFMRRVEEDGNWTLMCPSQCPGLSDCHGEEFDKLYAKYEKEGRAMRVVRARELWNAILSAQIETGTPYMLYKDACNEKSNQKNLGTIKSSNLCTEIVEHTSPSEVAVCNLASVCLPKFVKTSRGPFGSPMSPPPLDGSKPGPEHPTFDFAALHSVVKVMTRNLNKIIDVNAYPLPEASTSNKRHRPIGLGVSGLADTFVRMGFPFGSAPARELNAQIFETIYHAALEASCELAKELGTYDSYEGSPISKGLLQQDLWALKEEAERQKNANTSGGLEKIAPPLPKYRSVMDWVPLRSSISKHGVRNSLVVAPMPTASTSQILGVNECFEPYTSNLYVRRVKAGEFIVANPHLLQDLADRGLWNDKMRNKLVADGGSVLQMQGVPPRIRELYRTVWEMKMRDLIDMAADRGRYIDQSQSLNLFVAEPTTEKLTAMHFYGWKKGLKTGMYYLRTKPAANAIQFTVDKAGAKGRADENGGEACDSCQG